MSLLPEPCTRTVKMVSPLVVFITLAILFQPYTCYQGEGESECLEDGGIRDSQFSKSLDAAKVATVQITKMHSGFYQKAYHNASLYFGYQFSSRFAYASSVYLLSHYAYYDYYYTTLLCGMYGGHLPEISSTEVSNALKKFLTTENIVKCIYLGSQLCGKRGWIHQYSGNDASDIFSEGYPKDASKFAKMLKLPSGTWSVQDRPMYELTPCHMLCEVPK